MSNTYLIHVHSEVTGLCKDLWVKAESAKAAQDLALTSFPEHTGATIELHGKSKEDLDAIETMEVIGKNL